LNGGVDISILEFEPGSILAVYILAYEKNSNKSSLESSVLMNALKSGGNLDILPVDSNSIIVIGIDSCNLNLTFL
jgi:hypothetical protein